MTAPFDASVSFGAAAGIFGLYDENLGIYPNR